MKAAVQNGGLTAMTVKSSTLNTSDATSALNERIEKNANKSRDYYVDAKLSARKGQ